MDAIDKKILKILAANAYATRTAIGETVGLSVPAVNKRIAKLREKGVIKNVTVMTDPVAVGKPIIAYVLLVIQYGASVDMVLNYVNQDPDVLECQTVTGEYDYIIKNYGDLSDLTVECIAFLDYMKERNFYVNP